MRKAEKEARYEDVILNRCNFFFHILCLDFPKNRYVSETQGILSVVLGTLKLKTLYCFLDVKYLFTIPPLDLRPRRVFTFVYKALRRFLCQNLSGDLSLERVNCPWLMKGNG